ncbi:MAG: hypothetical protein HGB10_10110 [Coriobacteriia bacterium]|nr:hypothetical protein [Coriobacteriia bacterium]
MDLSVYLVTAVITTFTVGAAVALWLSIVGGHWSNLEAASRVVLDNDEPMPTRTEEAL